MGIFGIGTTEMIVILVAALIIFGPGKLPEVAGQMGRAVRDFRRMTSELTGEFEKTISDASDVKRTINKELTGMKSQVASVSNSVKRDLSQAGTGSAKTPKASSTSGMITPAKAKSTANSVDRAAAKTTSTARANASSRTPATVGVAPPRAASKADPFADLAIFDEPLEVPNDDRSTIAAASPAQRLAPERLVPAGTVNTSNDERDGAIERARQRRANAGYNRLIG